MADIAKMGEDRFVAQCQEQLLKKSYRPQPVRGCNRKGNWVIDVDIQGYFDNINAVTGKHLPELLRSAVLYSSI
ncbi:hypothetical protein Back11_07520 [Paenibacillus baekrokdamisoli]|uniref:Uncharacterized protein n=1 Tax=Paenibacillus baekrokdamisoli TaxID=1712516 RepID=A0A3G9IK77_9BACL|nr:hypothetical protein [Paenibacillus baekrokdamisoli]MBB3067407.1 hypothetical protein [Paenibacillus baekrokdamisoli]BBH19407.1 hypothetical protein Back11_07520 [Paenibacillus baekrokdamisoli]